MLLQNLLAENGGEEEEEQKEDVEDVRVVVRAFDDAFIVDNIVFGCENAFVLIASCLGYTRR
jgi:predicted TIM-barrel fold metal-dependent hydrolase